MVTMHCIYLQRYKYNEQLEPILSALMFVEQLESIQLFFTLVENSTHTSKTGKNIYLLMITHLACLAKTP